MKKRRVWRYYRSFGTGSIVQTNNITVTTSDTTINRGGGLVGYAEKSVINVSGTTNLSG